MMLESFYICCHITRRNWTVYKKDFIANISPTLADPAFMILSLGLGLGGYISTVEGKSYLHYLAPGLTVATSLFTSFFEASYGFYVRMTYENIFKAMLTTPIGVREIVWGEFLWVALKGALMTFGVALVLALFGLMPNWLGLPMMALTGLLVALPCGAMGLLASSLVRNINQFQSVYSFIIAPLYFFSGIFFPIEKMPDILQYIAKSLPLYHGVALAQSVFWGEEILRHLIVNGGMLLLQSVVLCIIAFHFVKNKLVQ